MSTTTSDAGTCLLVRGETKDELEEAMRAREAQGYKRQGESALVGRAWIGTLLKPGPDGAGRGECKTERLGTKVIITGPSESAVRDVVADLQLGGAKLLQPIERIGDEWGAVCDAPR